MSAKYTMSGRGATLTIGLALSLYACTGTFQAAVESASLHSVFSCAAGQAEDATGTVTQPGSGNATGNVTQPGSGGTSCSLSQPGANGTTTPLANCQALLPSWATALAPKPQVTVAANAATGMLPAIQPTLVNGPWHANANNTTLANSTQGIYAVLLNADTQAVVQTWNDPQANIILAEQIYNGQAFQLQASAPLAAGNYYILLFPTGAPMDASCWSNAGSAVAPLEDSVANICNTSPTFSVDSTGQITANSDYDVLVNTNFVSGSSLTSNPSLSCTPSQGGIDPLMIDFSGQGIQLSSQAQGIRFDMTGNGQSEQVSWPLGPLNTFLVHDITKPGPISGANFFGNYTTGPGGQIEPNGFAALAQYDENHDGMIDASDPIFGKLRLWSDANRNGVVDPGELKTLTQMGVVSIQLNAIEVHETDPYGNTTSLRALVNRINAGTRVISDIWFSRFP